MKIIYPAMPVGYMSITKSGSYMGGLERKREKGEVM